MGKHTYQHLVPQTYLRAWSSSGNGVWQLDKTTSEIKPANISNRYGINHEYSISPGAMLLSVAQCEELFSPLDEYTVKFEGELLLNAEKLNDMFPFYDGWEIYDKDGLVLGKGRKRSLKQEILKGRDISLEVKQIRHEEDKWPGMRDELVRRTILASGRPIEEFCRGFFIRYMVLQHWRGFGHSASENKALDFVDSIIPISNIEIQPENQIYKAGTNVKEEMGHDLRLKYLKQYFEGTGVIYSQAKWLLENATLDIYVAPPLHRFITSDTPCYAFRDSTVQLVFPITPHILITLQKLTQNGIYRTITLSDSNVKQINNYTASMAKQFLIAYDNLDF